MAPPGARSRSGLAGGFVSQIFLAPGKHLDPPHPLAFRLLAVAGALLAATWLLDLGPRLPRLRFPLLLAVSAAMGALALRASPNPPIDVFLFRQAGAEALARGENPYAASVPNLYRDRPFYGTGGFAAGDRVTGFPYPPPSTTRCWPSPSTTASTWARSPARRATSRRPPPSTSGAA